MKKGTRKKAATKTATPQRMSAEKPKKKASAKQKASAKPAPRTRSAPLTRKRSAARPSATRRRSVAVDLPLERALTDEERKAMAKVAQTALSTLAGGGVPERIVARIAMFVEEIRRGVRPEPSRSIAWET